MVDSAELISLISSYNPETDRALIQKAYIYAKNAHGSQMRHSGDAYITHPLAVAAILTELKVDDDSIAAALLHDVVEDTEVTLEDIENEFNANIASLVDGVTKLGKISNFSANEKLAENFRKLAVAMSQDIRVLLIKLADRLHNLRTLKHVPSKDRRVAKARESLDIYAPLAARIGLNKVKDEIQDLAFEVIDPDARTFIANKLNDLIDKRQDLIDKIIEEIDEVLRSSNIKFKIMGRQKTYYSIWNKMKAKNAGFHHLHDIMAFRVVVDDIPTCYQSLGILNTKYNMIPGTFRDYISTPKENGYRSLHIAVLGPFNKKIEIQIRDFKMHDEAELGISAHWSYKDNSQSNIEDIKDQVKGYRWIRDLISIFDNSSNAKDVLETNKLYLHKDEVFCFTPNGDIFNLPIGSTALDFAYAVHSEIGNHCVSAKINGIISPLRQKLENGDQIEIVTRKNAQPDGNWLQFVATAKARSEIRAFIRAQKDSENKKLGLAILNKYFLIKNKSYDEDLISGFIDQLEVKSLDQLYIKISEGNISRKKVFELMFPNEKDQINKPSTILSSKSGSEKSLPISGVVSGMVVNFSSCCNPIPGDEIVGIINTGSGVSIHNQECGNLRNLVVNSKRIIEVHWRDDAEDDFLYTGRLKMTMGNEVGTLAKIASLIAKNNINILNMRISNRGKDFCELYVDIEVKNSEEIESLISQLLLSKSITEIERWSGQIS